MDKNRNYASLKKFCLDNGADLCGVADISRIKKEFLLPSDILEGMDRALCVGIRLSRAIVSEISDKPTPLYFHHYRNLNIALDQLALKACGYIQKKGFSALPVPASQIIDWQNQKAHLSHKQIGYLAGLGWIGRNNLLVNSALGSQFRLSSILTDMPLEAGRPQDADCAGCFSCVRPCPAGAIKDNPADFDNIKCFEKLKEFQKEKLVGQYICGVCVKACRGRQNGI